MVHDFGYQKELKVATVTAKHAGELLREKFAMLLQSRCSGKIAPDIALAEVNQLILDSIQKEFSNDLMLGCGEKSFFSEPDDSGRTWLIKPHDGKHAFYAGYRNTAVSIALLDGDELVLGVVYAFNYPDSNGDLISWAKGDQLRRNDQVVTRNVSTFIGEESTALLANLTDQHNTLEFSSWISPMRYSTFSSIAYALALVSVGDADIVVCTPTLYKWKITCGNIAAGHALLLGAGIELYDEYKKPIHYSRQHLAVKRVLVIGGSLSLVKTLSIPVPQQGGYRLDFKNTFHLLDPSIKNRVDNGMLTRAQGCLLGQLSGDSLGSLVEFQSAQQIKQKYPVGVIDLEDGGTWNTLAGQPTDDSEMALMLARLLVRDETYQSAGALLAYNEWLDSEPFDIGNTIQCGLSGYHIEESQANGALMRISPLGIFGANFPLESVAQWAMEDAKLTHVHPVCLQVNALYAMAISETIKYGLTAEQVYARIVDWADEMQVEKCIHEQMLAAQDSPPEDFLTHQGWVLLAFRNALYQLLHAESTEEGIIDTVNRGGDTDTNAAISGALLGAVYGRQSIPERWIKQLLRCRPMEGLANVKRPRPRCYWPVDALIVAERLLQAGQN